MGDQGKKKPLSETLRRNPLVSFFRIVFACMIIPPLIVLAALFRGKRRKIIWGPVPIINNKYWSEAIRLVGYDSETLVLTYYSNINKKEDFDKYFTDLLPAPLRILPKIAQMEFACYAALFYVLRNAQIINIPFSGGPLGFTAVWWLEPLLFRLFGVRTVVIPYGADVFVYALVQDAVLRHGLMLSYPHESYIEKTVRRQVDFWQNHADAIVSGFYTDGLYRWDVPVGSPLTIDVSLWKSKTEYSSNDGQNAPVRVLHAPNHRGLKGTEFLIHAIDELRAEGLKIELVILEKVANDRVREAMQEVDIAADQFIIPGYGMFAVEAMASGLPVIAPMGIENSLRLFRYYSFLDECPVVAVAPDTIKPVLRALACHPQLRKQLGEAGRAYVEKYHSYETAQYLFDSIYRKLLGQTNLQLMDLFHPAKSEYNRKRPRVCHPLIKGALPGCYFDSAAELLKPDDQRA